MKLGDIYKVTSKGLEEDDDLSTNTCHCETEVKVIKIELGDECKTVVEDMETGNIFYVFPSDVLNGWLEKVY